MVKTFENGIKRKGLVSQKGERGTGLKFDVKEFATVKNFSIGTKIKYGANPKRAGSKSWDRYAGYSKAKTVGEALKFGSKKEDLMWELRRGDYKILGGARSDAQEIASIGQKAFDQARKILNSFIGPQGLNVNVDDPLAKEKLAAEEAWRLAKLKKCEAIAKAMGMKIETPDEVAAFNESTDIRLERRVADAVAAKKLKSGKKITDADVSEVLHLWGFNQNTGRLNVMQKGVKYVYSDTIGAIRRRTGGFGVTPPCQRYPNFPRILCKWLEGTKLAVKSKFCCTAININANYAGKRHRDQNNEGPSVIRAFGKFKGGKLRYWPKDFKKSGRCDVMELSTSDMVTHDLGKTTVVFDGNRSHEVESFTGERYSIVFFTARGYGKVKPDDVKYLKSCNFPWPTPKTLAEVKKETKTL